MTGDPCDTARVRAPATAVSDRGDPSSLAIARLLLATALGLLAAGAAFLFVVLVSGPPDDGETTYVHLEVFGLALAGVVASACAVIWGLARASPRPVLAGSAGVAVAAAVFMVAVESKSPPGRGSSTGARCSRSCSCSSSHVGSSADECEGARSAAPDRLGRLWLMRSCRRAHGIKFAANDHSDAVCRH